VGAGGGGEGTAEGVELWFGEERGEGGGLGGCGRVGEARTLERPLRAWVGGGGDGFGDGFGHFEMGWLCGGVRSGFDGLA